MIKLPSYCIQSNLSEKQIETDVATYLGWCTPSHASAPFRLYDVDESATGADKRFDGGALIYIQFKKSEGLKPTHKALRASGDSRPTQDVSTRKNKSKLQEIREFRGEHGLEDNPSLFFQLRAQAKNAVDLQHNILLEYECPPHSRAIYVAPLILDKQAYSQSLFDSTTRFVSDPFVSRHFFRLYFGRWASVYGAVPFLREHISIPPHERVATHEHFYSYSQTGVDIAWHSSEVISREPRRLSDFVSRFLSDAINNSEGLTTIGALANTVQETANRYGYDGTFDGENDLERLMNHGRWLRKTHGIRQFLLLGNKMELEELRSNL